MATPRYVLLTDDDASHAQGLEAALLEGHEGVRSEWVPTLARTLELVAGTPPWAMFRKLHLADSNGLATLETVLAVVPDAQIVVVGRAGDESLCRTALHHGARDYLLEGHLDTHAFARALRHLSSREVAQRQLRDHERARATLDSIGGAVLRRLARPCDVSELGRRATQRLAERGCRGPADQ